MVKHGKLTFEYSKITEYIYIGTNMCCQTHFDKSLIKKGLSADISLEEKTKGLYERLEHQASILESELLSD